MSEAAGEFDCVDSLDFRDYIHCIVQDLFVVATGTYTTLFTLLHLKLLCGMWSGQEQHRFGEAEWRDLIVLPQPSSILSRESNMSRLLLPTLS